MLSTGALGIEWAAISAISAATNTCVFLFGAVVAVHQLRRANRSARRELFQSLRDSYILSNHVEMENTKLQKLLDQNAEMAFLHGMLAQYEYAWRCRRLGDLTEEEFSDYANSMIGLGKMPEIQEALNKAKHHFDPEFSKFMRTGHRVVQVDRRGFFDRIFSKWLS
jgi:hypothetical protein